MLTGQSRWQDAAQQIVEEAEETLWSNRGEQALNHLLQRGLTPHTIRHARLGFIPGDYREWRTINGFRISCGMVIPWFLDGLLWLVKVRRAAGSVKYLDMEGSGHHGLYNADALNTARAALFCEGEFDTLLVQQEASEFVSPVTLGSPIHCLSLNWQKHFARQSPVFIAYDRDSAGERGMRRLLKSCPHFQPLNLPHGKDITDFYLNGGDLFAWIEHAITNNVWTLERNSHAS
jgi:hypothetical protein